MDKVFYGDVEIGEGVQVFEFTVLGKSPTCPFRIQRRPIDGDYPPLRIGRGCVISPHVTIYTGTTIGEYCLIGDNASIREGVTIGDECLIGRGVTVNYNARIGNHVRIMDGTHITGGMVIEDGVIIGDLVVTSNDSDPQSPYSENRMKAPIVRQGAVIGSGANLLSGVVIGEGAFVAAGSVVTKDVPPHTKVVGVPARVVE